MTMTVWLTMWRAWRTLTTRALSAMAARVADTQLSTADARDTWTSDPAAQPVATDLDGGAMMTTNIVRITDDTTKAELEQAITSHRETLRRMPAHWTDRRAAIHARIDAMLEDWEQAAE